MGVTASTHDKSRVGAAFRSKAPEVVLATLLRQDDIEHLHAVFQYKTFHALTPLHLGAKHSLQLLQLLLTHAGKLENEELFINSQHNAGVVRQLVNARSDRGVTPLMLAASRGCYGSCRLLLSHGADPWAIDRLGGRTALHYAVYSNCPELVQLLLDAAQEPGVVQYPNKSNTRYVDVQTQSGLAPLHFAVKVDAQQALAVLLSYNANLAAASVHDSPDCITCPPKTTALHVAATVGNVGTAQQLLKAYADRVDSYSDPRLVLNRSGQLPCMVAARRGHHDLAHLLHPDTPLAAAIGDVSSICQIGPCSLAQLAGAALRDCLLQQLTQAKEGSAATNGTAVLGHNSHAPGSGQLLVCKGGDAAAAAAGRLCTEGMACGVCLEANATTVLKPCSHKLCIKCCELMLSQQHRCVMLCPFCRTNVGGIK